MIKKRTGIQNITTLMMIIIVIIIINIITITRLEQNEVVINIILAITTRLNQEES